MGSKNPENLTLSCGPVCNNPIAVQQHSSGHKMSKQGGDCFLSTPNVTMTQTVLFKNENWANFFYLWKCLSDLYMLDTKHQFSATRTLDKQWGYREMYRNKVNDTEWVKTKENCYCGKQVMCLQKKHTVTVLYKNLFRVWLQREIYIYSRFTYSK